MTSFLSKIIGELSKTDVPLSNYTFILPSKRAGSFLKREISRGLKKPMFSPSVKSIEEFTEEIAELTSLNSVATLFEFYEVYRTSTPAQEVEDFETFSHWAQTLLHDFNEIDRYLIPTDSIFNYLARIQDINHWSLQPEKTELVSNY
ncbi:MAG: PD-(D/E)XK nuclease family protein, partial [Gillisia sp.]